MKAEDLVTQVQRKPKKEVGFVPQTNGSEHTSDSSQNNDLQQPIQPLSASSRAKRKFKNLWSLCVCFATDDDKAVKAVQRQNQDPYHGMFKPIMAPRVPQDEGKKTLVLDLDETLVHSSFRPIPDPDFIIPVEIEGTVHNVYVAKRPGVDKFLEQVGKRWEVVIFTASLSKYADPLLDALDIHKVIRQRLFREACVHYSGNYVKDLSKMGRPLNSIVIVDNSPHSYAFQPMNAIPVESWFDDMADTELYDLITLLEQMDQSPDVVQFLASSEYIQAKHQQCLMDR